MVVHWPKVGEAPFEEAIYGHIDHRVEKRGLDYRAIAEPVMEFGPDVVLISGWMDKDYLRAARVLRKQGIPVIAGSDTQYTGSLRQYIGALIAPWYLHTAIDILWCTGERQRQLAWKLGYQGVRCWSGFYACDWMRFARPHTRLHLPEDPYFLYAGRYIARKGIDILAEAYTLYRQQCTRPWKLRTAGSGELSTILEAAGIENIGFVQPDELPALMQQAAAFILPSRVEPWGVVVQEAAAAGLPLICTEACGAAVHLLQDGYNGYLVETGSSRALAAAMLHISTLNESEWTTMSQASFELSKQLTPEGWSNKLVGALTTIDGGYTLKMSNAISKSYTTGN